MTKSKLILYSLAIVVSDMDSESWEIECYPTEVLSSGNGTLMEDEEVSANVTDSKGEKISVTFQKSSTITASWISFGDYNRATAPDICRGEVVLLLRYAGEDKFFWLPLFSQFELRKKETVMYAYSNKDGQVETENELRTNMYYTQFDTVNKLVKLHTANNDGEQAGYDFIVNTGEGIFSITDTNENNIKWNSVDGTIEWNMTKDININSDGNIKVTSKENMELNFKGIKITNGSDELLTLLEDLIDAINSMQHNGNLGAPTNIMPQSKMQFDNIKQKITKMKG